MNFELDPKQEARLDRIVKRITERMSHEQQLALVERDARLQNFYKDRQRAIEQKKYLSIQIVERQMKARTDELLTDYAQRVLREAIITGDIIHYLDDDQRERYNTIRGIMFLCMQVLDSSLQDMTGFIHYNGMNGTCKMLPELKKAQDCISKWCNDTVPVLKTEASELALDECDHLYEHIKSRAEVLNRKASRLLERLEKKQQKEEGAQPSSAA